jgi:regulatory protein
MIVTGIERQKKHPDRYSIYVDGDFAVGVRAEILLSAGLRKGDAVTPERIEQLRNEEELGSARGIASRYIGIRRRTEWEVRRRLGSKEFPPSVIDRVVAELITSGLIDDRGYILAFVHDAQLRKPSGPRMLTAKLRGKGLGREIIGEVLPVALPAGQEEQLALDCARGYLARLERRAGGALAPAKIRNRLRGYLSGRGFDSAAISGAMKFVLPRAGAGDDPDPPQDD